MRISSFVIGLSVLTLFLSCANKKEPIPAKEEIPIFAYHGMPLKFTTTERFKEMKDCGILYFSAIMDEEDAIRQCLDTAAAAGVKAVIDDKQLEKEPEEFVRKFKDHPGLGGYFLADEPGTEGFKWIGEWAKRIRSIDTTHFCYVNLLPIYALGEDEYEKHLSTYCKEVPLPYISFDYYPVLFDKENQKVVVSPFYYQNLQIVSDWARKTGRTFSGFALTTAHAIFPIPTSAHLRFQFYTNLAYGAQSLQIFTYWTPKEYGENDFHLGPLTRKGKRSQVYELLREVTQEIQNRAFVFLGAKMQSVCYQGDTIPKGTKPLETLPPHFSELQCHGGGVLISTLRKGNNTYIVMVNGSPTDPLSINIATDENVMRIRKDGSLVSASLYDSSYTIEPGAAEIFSYKE